MTKVKTATVGLRHNEGKVPLSLIDPTALYELGKVLQFGASKYAKHNWRKGLKIDEVIDSLMRHVLDFNNGEDNDKETGLSHMGHVMCNAMFIIWLMKHRPDMDTRWKNPITLKDLKAFTTSLKPFKYEEGDFVTLGKDVFEVKKITPKPKIQFNGKSSTKRPKKNKVKK